MATALGTASASDIEAFQREAAALVPRLVMAGPLERSEIVSEALAGFIGQSSPQDRFDALKGVLDAFAADNPEDALVGKSDWARLSKAFRAKLAETGKKQSRQRFEAAVAKEAEFSEAVFSETVAYERLEGEYAFATGLGWLAYTGAYWKTVDVEVVTDVVRKFAAETAIERLQQGVRDPRELSAMMKAAYIKNVTSLASGIPGIRIHAEEVDAQVDLLNVANGTVNLRTGELRPHDHADYFTKCAPTDYVPGATDAAWDQALSSMEADTIEWMQLRYGNGVTGHPADDHRMCFLNGSGGNGKSMHLEGIGNAIGTGRAGYMSYLSEGAIVGNADKEAIMSFRGARLALVEELPEGRQLNVTTMKRLVGTPTMTGRHLYQKEITWNVSHSLFVTSNYDLNVNESDDGTWRRLAKVPFPYSYVDVPAAPHERLKDRSLSGRLATRSAREACLAWLVAGAVRWYREGLSDLNTPETVRAATLAWRGESDVVLKFFTEMLVPAEGSHIASSDMLKAFNDFMGEQSQSSWSAKTMTGRMKDHAAFRGAGIGNGRVRGGQGAHPVASRKGSDGYHLAALPAQYAAFTGVRFRTEADDLDEMTEPDPLAPSQEPAAAPVVMPVDPMPTVPLFAAQAPSEDPWTDGYVSDGEWSIE